MALPYTWLTWLSVFTKVTLLCQLVTTIKANSWPLANGNCVYQECATNPLAECHYSSDWLINCESREACQRVIVFKVLPESPLKENLSISLHSFGLRVNTSIDLTLDVSYTVGSHHNSVALQQFKCQFNRDNSSTIATMIGHNESIVYGDSSYNGESIHCQWIMSPDGPLWPIKLDGKPLNLYNHVFTRNRLSVNSSEVSTFIHSLPIQRLRYITDTLYPNNGLPFNPCQLSQDSSSSSCAGEVIIIPNHQDETYLDIYLIVFDQIKGINLLLKHSPDQQKIGLLRCRSEPPRITSLSPTSLSSSSFDSSLDSLTVETPTVSCHGILDNNPTQPEGSYIGQESQLGSTEASALFNSTGLRAFWRVPVSFAQLWNSRDPDGVDFLLDIHIWLYSGDQHSVRGTLKVPLTQDYPSPLDVKKCSTTESSSPRPSMMSSPGQLFCILLTLVLTQLLH